jgi:hypothetical protein
MGAAAESEENQGEIRAVFQGRAPAIVLWFSLSSE